MLQNNGQWSLINQCTEFWLSLINDFEGAKYISVFQVRILALEETGAHWLGVGIQSMLYIWSLVLNTPMIQNLASYLDFEGAKNICDLWVPIWGFGGCWRLLTVVWHLDLHLGMVTDLWFTRVPNFGSPSWFWRGKEHLCPLNPDIGFGKCWGFLTRVL